MHKELNPRCRTLPENITAHSGNSLCFMETEVHYRFAEACHNGLYCETDESSPHPDTHFLNILIFLPSTIRSLKMSRPFRFSIFFFCIFHLSHTHVTCPAHVIDLSFITQIMSMLDIFTTTSTLNIIYNNKLKKYLTTLTSAYSHTQVVAYCFI